LASTTFSLTARFRTAASLRFICLAIVATLAPDKASARRRSSSCGVQTGPVGIIFPSPSVRRIATSAEESHPLNSVAQLATILNDVFAFSVGGAFLKLHCLFAYNAVQETYQRAFIVVQ
jgi:hypothetical protein